MSDFVRQCRGVLVVLAAVMFCVALAGPSAAETRSLKLYFLHTKEKATIAYKKNGRYIPSGLKKINRFLRDWRRNEPTKMDPRLLDLLWEVYRASGARKHIHVVSAYRSPATNAMLRKRSKGVAKRSQHMLGRAIDFYIPDVKLSKLRRIAMKAQVGGVGYYPRSGSPFVHLDVGNVRSWPRMSRKDLVSLFPNGKTLHLPTDGKPLPGYKQAMADYKSRVSSKEIRLAGQRSSGGSRLAGLFRGGNRDKDEAQEEKPVRVTRQRSQPQPREQRPSPQAATVALAYIPTPLPRPEPPGGGVALANLNSDDPPIQVALAPSASVSQVALPRTGDRLAGAGSAVPVPTQPQRKVEFSARVAAAQAPTTGQAFLLAPATSSNNDANLTVASIQTPVANGLIETATEPADAAFVPTPTLRPTTDASDGLVLAAAYAPEVADVDSEALVGGIPVPRPSPFGALNGQGEMLPAPVDVALAPPSSSTSAENGILESAFAPLTRANGGKGGRPNASDAANHRPGSIRTEPVLTPNLVTNRAFVTSRVAVMKGPGRRPDFVSAYMRSAPHVVHLDGFSTSNTIVAADRFAGRAVNFETVARFVARN